ncbi:MAG: hypothetical protein JRJ24_10535, partial [Deltaproteobacteria bacterium]|nr:hypothetical protein [Deltaproteobacteria bacterium]
MDDATYDFGEEGEQAAKPRRPGFPVEPRRLLRILADHRKPLLKAFLIAAAVALLVSFFVPKTYESTAQLLFEGTPLLERKGGDVSPDAFVESALSPTRLREVRDRLNWDVSLSEIEDQVEVWLEGKAAMYIVGQAGTADEAQALAQTTLDVFLAGQANFNAQKLERLTEENRTSMERAKERRQEANQAYDVFREKSGKPDLIQEQTQLLERAAALRSSADEAGVEVAAQRARIEEFEKAQRELPRQIIASATKGSPIDSPLAAARSELAAARASLSDRHPTVQALKQRVASLQAQRKGQTAEIGEQTLAANPARASVDQQLATARAELAAAKERESALRVLLKAIKDEAALLAPVEGEARQIVGALELANERVDELSERAAILRDAMLGPMTGFRLLSAPMLPEESKPSTLYVLLLVMLPILTVLILALVFLVRQLRSLRVEAPREVAWWGNGPVLGTSVWPRDPEALDSFVDELEDHGVYGAGRTLVVPATEAEREIACSFAMRLAEAPWLAAAILDVGDRAGGYVSSSPLVTPPAHEPRHTPPSVGRPRRLSSQASPSVARGRVIRTPAPKSPVVTPPPASDMKASASSRPPRKKTMVGLPAVQSDGATRISTQPRTTAEASPATSAPPAKDSIGPEPFRRKRGARATVRMVVPGMSGTASMNASAARDSGDQEDAFLLTRPVPVATDQTPSRVGRAVHVSTGSPHASASNAVMRAAVRLLGHDDDDITSLRRSEPPATPGPGEVTGVALTWNGPLSGPLLRRAARLAHRVMVVVSSGMSVVELARIRTRLGREKGVGYVLVNVSDAYVDLRDR